MCASQRTGAALVVDKLMISHHRLSWGLQWEEERKRRGEETVERKRERVCLNDFIPESDHTRREQAS